MFVTVDSIIAQFSGVDIFNLLNDCDQTEPQWSNETFPITATLRALIAQAEFEVLSYLAAYDKEVLRNDVPDALIKITSDIVFYNCYKYCSFLDMPAEIASQYKKCLEQLQSIADGSFILYNDTIKPSPRFISAHTEDNFLEL